MIEENKYNQLYTKLSNLIPSELLAYPLTMQELKESQLTAADQIKEFTELFEANYRMSETASNYGNPKPQPKLYQVILSQVVKV